MRIDGELFEIRPVGASLLLDIAELEIKMSELAEVVNSVNETGANDQTEEKSLADRELVKKQLASGREMFNIVEDLLIPKGKKTSKEAVKYMSQEKLQEFLKLLMEF